MSESRPMGVEEMRAMLADADARIADKLREVGFTEPEIASFFDPSLSIDERKRRSEAALARIVAAQMSDPHSALVRAAIERVAAMSPEEILAYERAHQRRRRNRWLLLGGIVAVVGGIALYFALRPPNPCVAALGPLAELEAAVHKKLDADKPIGPYGRSKHCSLYVWEKAPDGRGHVGNPIMFMERGDVRELTPAIREHERKRFASSERFALGDEAMLFVASDEKGPSAEELLATAKSHRPRRPGEDPIGAMLGSLPPPHHVVLVRRGDTFLQLGFERKTFDAESAKASAARIVSRVK